MMKQVKIRIPMRVLALLLGLFLSVGAFAQSNTVTGQVKDATGEPVIGATVRIDGQNGGAITDFDGNFTIEAPAGATLTISYIGYQDAKATAAPHMVVVMQEDGAQGLNEVVVIGYGRAKKSDLTGSVTAIKPDELSHGLQTSADDMLSGKVAGLNIVSEGGAPGAGSKIRIRGGSSLSASNDPLYVIDGLQVDPAGISNMNPLASINPNDIESFTVLKDASATAIYGSRASNGVIIITTKKGRAGQKAKVSYNGNVSISTKKKTLDVFDGPGLQKFVAERFGEDSPEYSLLGYYEDGEQKFANTNWQDEIYRTAVSTDHNITVTGGTANMPYRVSAGFTYQPGIVKSTFFRRYTGSFNLAPVLLNDHLRLNITGKIMSAQRRWDNGAVGEAAYMDPTKPVRLNQPIYNDYFNGYFQWAKAAGYPNDDVWGYTYVTEAQKNPVALVENNGTTQNAWTFQGNIGVDYAIHGFEDLHVLANLAGNLTRAKQETNNSPYTTSSYYYGWNGWNRNKNYNNIFNIFLQYTKELQENVHNLDVQVGYEWQRYHAWSDNYGYGIIPETASVDAGKKYNEPTGITEWKSENRLRSWIGRVNYTLLNRYLFTFTMRADGSSRFAKGHEWGYFPAAAFAWRVKEESFLRDINTVDDLKLRLTYGKTGQQNLPGEVGDFYYLPTFTSNYNHAYYPLFGDGKTVRPGVYNPDLTWEKTTTYDVGFDLSMWNNRFTLTADWYYRKTTDLINNIYVPAGANFGAQTVGNIGELHNTGIEFMTTVRPIVTGDLNWEITYNFTYNKNKIDDLASDLIEYGGIGMSKNGKAYQTGHSSSSFYVYRQVYDQNGNIVPYTFVDRNGNGILDSDDRYFYYHADPDVTMGLGSKVIYKNWDFSFNSRASFGNHVFNANLNSTYISSQGMGSTLNFMHNIPTQALKYGITASSDAQHASDCWIQNASYFKLDNITVGYSFQKLFGYNISGRAYVTAQNIFTITKYDGLDPENQNGIESSIYPRPFTTILGVNLNF